MRIVFISVLFSSTLLAQGNFGVNFGLNDDNFGSITDLKNKIDNYNLDIKIQQDFSLVFFLKLI